MLRRTLLFALAAFCVYGSEAAAQARTITGRITDATTGRPLPGAQVYVPLAGGNVAVEGRRMAGTVTNNSGTFTLNLAEAGDVTLVVRLIGYERTEVTVGAGQGVANVALATNVLNLEEVVVTGQATGIQRRNLANAVSSVSAEQLNIVPTASLETQLAAKVPGADVQANSGAPGGGNQINLRGVSTIIGNSTPLYVVDGVIISDVTINSGANSVTGAGGGISSIQDQSPNRIADLNPADIQNIEILKGASAAAIYGSKANNGVIIITTKRGRAGAPRYTVTQRVGVSQLANKLGTRTFRDSATAVGAFGAKAAPFFANGRVPQTYDLEEQLAGGNPLSTETALSVSGGTENTRYYVSGLARNEDAVVRGTYYDKYSLKLNLDQALGDRASLAFRTNAIHSKTGRGFTGNDNTSTTYYLTLTGTPSFVDLRRRDDGSFPENPFQASNPLQTAALATNDEAVYRFIGSTELSYDAIDAGIHGLRFLVSGGGDFFSQKNVIYSPEGLQYEQTNPFPGTSLLSNSYNTQLNANANAVHTLTPESGRWTATTSVGARYEYRDQDVARSRTQNLFAGQQNVGEGTVFSLQENRSREKDISFFGQEELLFAERLLVTAGLNVDRSSNNSETDKLYYYPKFASSYRLPVRNAVLDEFKLRAAYGEVGNLPRYGQKFNVLNPGSVAGQQTLLLGGTTVDPNLRPERQIEVEGGFDAVLWGNRASLEFTAYERRIKDLLLNRSLPPSTGFSTALFNSEGQLTTSGIEAAVNTVPVQLRNFSWNSRVTFSRDRSVVDSLPVPPFNYSGGGFGTSLGSIRIQQGKSATALFGRDTTTVVDDPRCLEFLDVAAGSGSCPAGTRVVTQIGDANPDFRMGFINDFTLGNFNLATTLDWQSGGNVVNLTGFLLDINQNTADFDAACTGSNCRPGETKGQQRLRVYPGRTSTTWLEDGSFLKLREVTLTFAAPQRLLQNQLLGRVENLSVSLSGRNLLTWTDYSGFDPEVNQFGSQAIRGNIDVTPYPPSRTFWLSATVGF